MKCVTVEANIVFLTLSVLFSVQLVSSSYFKPEWHRYVMSLICDHEKCAFLPTILSYVKYRNPDDAVNDYSYMDALLLPEVIIWDPVLQFPVIFDDLQTQLLCNKEKCGKEAKFFVWQDGSTERYYPRCIYGMYGIVLLVCRIYRCSNGHMMTSCDPHFLDYFPERHVIPFFLLHKSGATRNLQSFIFHLSSQGKSFADIQNTLLWTIQTHHAQKMSMCRYLHGHAATDVPPCFPKTWVSKDFIINAFLITYNELKEYFFSEMYAIQADYISCDHTFRLASHIGIYHNNKWVPQYNSLFIMQNERGQILFWQLTMGTAYASVCDGIELLKHRNLDKNVKMLMVDNCCMWRAKLQKSFGDQVKVKLDLFHAVKRITTALSKRHPYFYTALQDFRLVFRMSGDNGAQRTKCTPDANSLLKNVNAFLAKWSNITDSSGNLLITPTVLKEIDHLKVHINRGCLSDIPPSFGTSKNENLHRSLNARFSGNKLGVEVAVALLATFFHLWNSKHNCSDIMSSLAQYLDKCNKSKENLQHLPETTIKFGIGISSERSFVVDNISGKNKTNEAWDVLKSINASEKENETIYYILHNALCLLHSEETLNKISHVHAKISRILPTYIAEHEQVQLSGTRMDESSCRLDNILLSFGLQKHEVPSDGDCLFTSIVLHLEEVFKLNNEYNLIKGLNSNGITMENCDVLLLRALMVEEWLLNQQDYQSFFTDASLDFEHEAEKYRNCGVFASCLGDAMLLGLSNALQMQIIVFTSIPSWPHFTIYPRCPPVSQNSIYLAYLHGGSGHYCLAIKQTETATQHSTSVATDNDLNTGSTGSKNTCTCRCGRGRNSKSSERVNCCENKSYSSRCPCLKALSLCTDNCKCISCGNGKKTSEESLPTVQSRRKRPRHLEQAYLKEEGWKFMKKENEQTLSGMWTPQEHYIFVSIVMTLRKSGNSLEVSDISSLYAAVKQIIECDAINIVLSPKSDTQIRSKLNQLLKEEEIQQSCGTINYLP